MQLFSETGEGQRQLGLGAADGSVRARGFVWVSCRGEGLQPRAGLQPEGALVGAGWKGCSGLARKHRQGGLSVDFGRRRSRAGSWAEAGGEADNRMLSL